MFMLEMQRIRFNTNGMVFHKLQAPPMTQEVLRLANKIAGGRLSWRVTWAHAKIHDTS